LSCPIVVLGIPVGTLGGAKPPKRVRALRVIRQLAAVFALAVAGCGGGGSSSPNTGPVPPAASLEVFATIASARILAADSGGNLFTAAYTGNGFESAIYKVTPAGAIVRLPVVVAFPTAVATDTAGNVYVGDASLCVGLGGCTRTPVSILQKVAPDGTVVPIKAVRSSDQSGMEIASPSGLAVSATGAIYFSDGRHTIRKLTQDGDLTTVAGMPYVPGEVDGAGSMARFSGPAGIAIDSAGNLFVADTSGNTIRRVTPAGEVTTIAGRPFTPGDADGAADLATFAAPPQVAVDSRGNVHVADFGNALIRRISEGVVSTLAGTRGQVVFQPGPLPGTIDLPRGIAVVGTEVYFTTDSRIGVVRGAP
jgi:sugar lactone lactonase YvrE